MTDEPNTNQEDLTPSTNEGKSKEEAEKFIERFKSEKDTKNTQRWKKKKGFTFKVKNM